MLQLPCKCLGFGGREAAAAAGQNSNDAGCGVVWRRRKNQAGPGRSRGGAQTKKAGATTKVDEGEQQQQQQPQPSGAASLAAAPTTGDTRGPSPCASSSSPGKACATGEGEGSAQPAWFKFEPGVLGVAAEGPAAGGVSSAEGSRAQARLAARIARLAAEGADVSMLQQRLSNAQALREEFSSLSAPQPATEPAMQPAMQPAVQPATEPSPCCQHTAAPATPPGMGIAEVAPPVAELAALEVPCDVGMACCQAEGAAGLGGRPMSPLLPFLDFDVGFPLEVSGGIDKEGRLVGGVSKESGLVRKGGTDKEGVHGECRLQLGEW